MKPFQTSIAVLREAARPLVELDLFHLGSRGEHADVLAVELVRPRVVRTRESLEVAARLAQLGGQDVHEAVTADA